MKQLLQLWCCMGGLFVSIALPAQSMSLYQPTRWEAVVISTLKQPILARARWALRQAPITVTATSCERSAGGLHDFYSEGDYWWPNPEDPKGPYIQRDGHTNPDNFVAHRHAMVRFSQIIGYLASAYQLTRRERYVRHAFRHLRAWFVAESTRMNPSLNYAQAIKGRATGRGIGIIDMIQMLEVAQGIRVMEHAKSVNAAELARIKQWFADYLQWVTTHPYGLDERAAKNNHGTCWVLQVVVFAQLVGDSALVNACKSRFQTVLLPTQLAADGSFPLELRRTKPYGYALFNLDAMATLAHILSDSHEDLWTYRLSDGRQLANAVHYLYPYVQDKTLWPFPPDVLYFEQWPVAHPFLLFAYHRFHKTDWLQTWQRLPHFPETPEVIRNLPVRNPLIW